MLNKAIKKAKENKKGFTLAELLIVVAIIAVLVAISIPIFNSQLEKSREAVDISNIRAAYAEIMTADLTEVTTATGITYSATDNSWSKTVEMKQNQNDWQTDTTNITIGDTALPASVQAKGTATIMVKVNKAAGTNTVTISYAAKTK